MASLDVFKSKALPLTLVFEGGYSDHKKDKGGKTFRGITTATYFEYRENRGLPVQPVTEMSDEEMFDIYLNWYWLPGNCAHLPDLVAIAAFDSSVNHGPRRSNILLQRAAGVKVDGVVGPVTLRTVMGMTEQDLLTKYLSARKTFYDTIVEKDPTQQEFYKGWKRRLNMLTAYVNGTKTFEQIKKQW